MRRLPRNIGGSTRMACGCKHFDLVVRFTSFSCKMRAFPILLPSYLFFVLQERMRSPLMGPSRGMSIGMTALANDNATNFNTKRNKKKKEKKRKKEDPWKKPKTHTRNGKRRLRLSTWLTLLTLQVQVQVQLHRARQSTPHNHEPRRNVVCTATHHCTNTRVTWFRSFTVNPCLQQQWSGGRRTGRRDAVRQSQRRGCTQDARRARYPRGGVTCLLVLFVHFFLFASFFSRTLYICWLVCLGRKGAEELIRRMKERQEAKDREEEVKRKESGMCLSHPLCRAVTMAHYGPICA